MSAPKRGSGSADDAFDPIARAVRAAGVRASPDATVEQSVRGVVEREWRETVLQRRKGRLRRTWLAAAVVAVTVGVGWIAMRQTGELPPEPIGTLIGTRDPVHLTGTAGHRLNASGESLVAGTRIETGPGGAALLTLGSIGVRVGSGSVLELEHAGAVRLVRGRLYVDSGEHNDPGRSFLVATEFGTVTHRGTQYQVQVDPGRSLFTGVREGTVEVHAGGHAQSLTRGEGVRVNDSRGMVRETVSPYGELWQWVSDYAPEIYIDGRSLTTFLEWFARETGRTVVFVAPASRAAADQTVLSGSVSGLTPLQALDAVMATTGFRCDLTVPGQVRVIARAPTAVRIDRHGVAIAASKACCS
jgi:FecR protein